MLTLQRPDEAKIRAQLARQAGKAFSHEGVGLTRAAAGGQLEGLPPGYVVDHNRVKLGTGAEAFERARRAVESWKMFDIGWAELCWPTAPIEVDSTVGILLHAGVAWSLSAARIVYALDEQGDVSRFGFGYGTLPDHAECGEERFQVEYHASDGSVWYDLLAFSKPGNLLTRLAGRYARGLQHRFARHSLRAMARAVE